MRNVVSTLDQSSLAGCPLARIGVVDAEQRGASDGDCSTMRRQPSIDLQLARRLGTKWHRGLDRRACGRQTAQAEQCVAGYDHRIGPNGSADLARSGATRRSHSWPSLSTVARPLGGYPQEIRLQLQTHTNESKKNRNTERFAACKAELAGLKSWAQQGGCPLFYYDEAGFSASPSVQRAWSPVGCPHAVTPAYHQRVTAMGALNFAGKRLHHALALATVNRETFINFMEDLIPRIAKSVPTFIILDNARIHHGLDDRLTLRWMKEFNTFLCYLPTYSPKLNMIEILWKQAKYHWRDFVTWSKDSFRFKISELLNGVGSKFQIDFA